MKDIGLMFMLRFEQRIGKTELTIEHFMSALDSATRNYNALKKGFGKIPDMNKKEWIISYGIAILLRVLGLMREMHRSTDQTRNHINTAAKEMRELEAKFL